MVSYTPQFKHKNNQKLHLTVQKGEFLSLKVGCTSSSESILVKMPHCWKSHVSAQMSYIIGNHN